MSGSDAEPRLKFHVISRLFHWLVAGLILLQIPLAYQMIAMSLGPDKFSAYALHKSLGLTVFLLTSLRLAWRAIKPPPALPASMSARERLLARTAHGALYAVTLAMPLAGWCYSSAAAFSVSYFGLFTLPDLVPPSETLETLFEWLHRLLAYALFALLAGHLLAAAFHHWVRKDNVLISMLPFGKLRS